MRTQAELVRRRQEIRQELEDDSIPQSIKKKLDAQEDILTWIIEGDVLPDEYVMEGRLKMSGKVFDEVVLAGRDSGGRVYPAETISEEGEYVIARKPTPQELDEMRKG